MINNNINNDNDNDNDNGNGNDNKKTIKCNTTYCGSLLDRKINKSFYNHEKQVKNLITKSKTRKFKTKIQKEMFKIMTKKISEKDKKKSLEDSRKLCKEIYCNINCKDTLLEPNKLSKKYIKENKIMIDYLKNKRTELFGNKTNVLENSFYNKLSKKISNKLQKQGAISMCSDKHY